MIKFLPKCLALLSCIGFFSCQVALAQGTVKGYEVLGNATTTAQQLMDLDMANFDLFRINNAREQVTIANMGFEVELLSATEMQAASLPIDEMVVAKMGLWRADNPWFSSKTKKVNVLAGGTTNDITDYQH